MPVNDVAGSGQCCLHGSISLAFVMGRVLRVASTLASCCAHHSIGGDVKQDRTEFSPYSDEPFPNVR